jgi:hypothetical protein
MFNNFFPENCVIYEINVEKHDRVRQTTYFSTLWHMHFSILWRMHIACWITKVTDTHSEYVILIASPLQQWFRKHILMLCSTYIT